MMDRARYEYLKDRFKYYVPLRGFDETTAEDIWDYSRENHSGDFTAPLKAVKGRQSKPAAPFAYIRAMANSAFMHDNQNALRLAILRFVANRPEQQLITVSDSWYTDSGQTDDDGNVLWEPRYPQIDPDMTMEEREEAVRKFEEEMRELEMQGKAVMGDKRLNLRGAVVHIDEEDKHRHMVRVMHLGKEKFLVFNGNPRAAIALNGLLNIEGKRGKMAGARAVTRFMSAMNTSYSPKFWFRNLSKDFFTGLFNTTINEDASYLGKYVKNYAHVLGNMPIMARRGEFKDNPNWSKEERARVKRICDLYKTYVKNGGPTGYATVTRTEEYEAELQRLVQKGKMKQVEQAKAIWNWVRKIGDLAEIFEQVPRFATFITSREEGRSIERSIKDAKDVTLDFNMKGAATHTGMDYIKKLQHQKRNGEFRDLTAVERVFYYALANLSPYARACIMFFNPAVQSVEKTIRNYKNHPWKASGLGLALIASGFLQGMLDTFFAPDGDDEKKDIGKIRNQGEYKRSSNAIIRLSKTFFLTLPLSPEFAVFHELGVQLFDVLYHRYGPEDKPVYDAVKTLTNTLPLDPLNPVDWTPSLVRPALEAATNKDFRGAKIAYNNTFNKDVPGWRKSPDSTWDWFLALSQWANEASGGDYSKKGWANFNPAQWQHVLEGMGGGLLRDVIGAADEVGRLVGDEDWDFRHTVLLSNFFLNTKDYKDGYTYQLFNQFYDLGADANRRHNQYIKEGDIIRRFEIEGTREWAYWEIYQDKYKKAIDALKKELKSGGQGKDERQVRSDALYELYGSYAQECMDLFYDRDWKEK